MSSPWPPPVPPGWYPDPDGHHELRWHDGRVWTAHVHGSRPDDGRDGGAVPLRGALIGLAVLLATRVLVELAVRPLRDQVRPLWVIGAAFYVLVFGPMAFTALRGLDTARSAGRWLRSQLQTRDLAWGVLVWVSTIASGAVTVPLINALGIPFRTNGEVVSAYRTFDRGLFTVTMIAAVVGAPIVEELFFRGLVLRGFIERVPAWAAVGAQAVLFGLYHLIPGFGSANAGLVIVLTGYGLVLGLWARHFRRLGPSMIGHAITNSVVFVVVLLR